MNLLSRFKILDGQRLSKMSRSRGCAALTIPLLLPPDGWGEELSLPQTYSSVAARGVTSLSSRILSALIPLNDSPFFAFGMKDGSAPPHEVAAYLETLSYQVYRKLISTNLRETVFQALQSLIVAGDSLIMMDDDYFFCTYRLDQFVVQRDVMGEVIELLHLEYEVVDPNDIRFQTGNIEHINGFRTLVCQYLYNEETHLWTYNKEDSEGVTQGHGEYIVPPFAVLRWTAMTGENYGRSHCEDIIGDLKSLEAFTRAQIEGLAAASTFWIAVDPSGTTEVDDIAKSRNGSFVAARQSDVYTISPATTMTSQVQAAGSAVENMRREVGQAFLSTGQAIPSGDRVTATAVRMIGSELETILGGAFSSIARTLMEPVVKRCLVQMLDDELLDQRLTEQFFAEDSTLAVDIITGLQALSRDSDLQKLMQMGEMVRNLPPEAIKTFRWDAYSSALISALGFDPRMWVKDEATVKSEVDEATQQQMKNNTQGMVAQAGAQAAGQAMGGMAQQAMRDPAIAEQAMQTMQEGMQQ